MLRIGICEDDREVATKIENLLLEIGKQRNIIINLDVFYDGLELIKYIEMNIKNRYDILYMDIQMKKMNGIEAAIRVRNIDLDVLLVFISGYENYAIELFKVEAFRFLIKPVDKEHFLNTFDIAYNRLIEKGTIFEYNFNKMEIRIPVKEIIYFESKGRAINIKTIDNTEIFYNKLSTIEKDLEIRGLAFFRVSQSYLVNFMHIKKISYTKLVLTNEEKLNISQNRQKEIRKKYFMLLSDDKIG